jgi:predicted amidohydrolase YtcJ
MHSRTADMVLVNGNIITMNPKQTKAEAVAIKGDRLIAIGGNREILDLADENTRKIDLKGKTVLPGLIDSHVHGLALGKGLSQIDLRHVKSIEEIQEKIRGWAQKTEKGAWIIGRGWDQDKLLENRFPSRSDLDGAAPNHPVIIWRVCGHLGVVNSQAMRLAGIDKNTKPPQGGVIDRDSANGEPNGILRETSLHLVSRVLPKLNEEELMKFCLLACQEMVESGLTTVHWIISRSHSTSEMRALQQLDQQGRLPIRIYAILPVEHLDRFLKLSFSESASGMLKLRGVKILADGSLGARTAALKEPYTDAPSNNGILLYSRNQLRALVEEIVEESLQLVIHAIGDRTIETVLEVLENTMPDHRKTNQRHRIEHVSVLNPNLLKRMKRIGIIASVQPHFAVSDTWILKRLGKGRARWTYVLRSLFDEGIRVIGGSDAPVEPVSAIYGIHAAVAREAFPEECLTVDEALQIYTRDAAYGSFEENLKGSLEASKLADLIVVSQDPLGVAPELLKEITVETTILGGQVVFSQKA